MAKRIDFKEFTPKDAGELLYHMSVQSLLDLKSINGQITFEDIMEASKMAVYTRTVLFNGHVAYVAFGIPSETKGQVNLFLYATTEGYSKMQTMKESLFSVINDLQKFKICSIVYKGNKKLQSLLRANDFKFDKNLFFGKERRMFSLFVRE